MPDKASEEKRLKGLIEALEARHPDREGRDWMPWATYDHPIAVEHWKLVQERLNLRYGRVYTPEQREAARERLNTARAARQDAQPSVLAC